MIEFLLSENVLTAAAFTGMFNTSFLTSFKNHIIEPFIEKLIKITNTSAHFGSKFTETKDADQIKWKLFMREFIIWIFSQTMVYIVWKFIVHPYKASKLN